MAQPLGMITPVIPDGWYQLGPDELVIKGDMCGSGRIGSYAPCSSSIGFTPATSGNVTSIVFIRKGQKQEKIWLNPWE